MIKSILLLLLFCVSMQSLHAADEPEIAAPEPISAQQMIQEHLQQRDEAERQAEAASKEELPLEEELQLEEEFPSAVEADGADLDELLLLPEDDELEYSTATDTIDLEPEKNYEKADSMPPALLLRGTPGIEEDSGMQKEDIVGRFVPEPQPLNRRRHIFYRWALETFEGRRIPLKSNLKLLQEIRSEKFLDGYVRLRGYYLESGFDERLKYFVVESVAAHDGPDGLVEPAVIEDAAPASFTLRDKIRR